MIPFNLFDLWYDLFDATKGLFSSTNKNTRSAESAGTFSVCSCTMMCLIKLLRLCIMIFCKFKPRIVYIEYYIQYRLILFQM